MLLAYLFPEVATGPQLACGVTALLVASLAISVIGSGLQYAQAEHQANRQEELAKDQAQFERSQAQQAATEAAEQAAEERQALSEEAARARGVVLTSEGLGSGSLRSFLADISRREGRANAIIDRNLELISTRRQAQFRATSLQQAGRQLQIDANRPNAAVTALSVANQAISTGVQIRGAQQNRNELGTVRTGSFNVA